MNLNIAELHLKSKKIPPRLPNDGEERMESREYGFESGHSSIDDFFILFWNLFQKASMPNFGNTNLSFHPKTFY